MNRLFAESLDAAIDGCDPALLRPLMGARLLITGASGFFGGWVLRAIRRLNSRAFGIHAYCVSRNPDAAASDSSDYQDAVEFTWLKADAESFAGLQVEGLTHILHMAATSHVKDRAETPIETAQTILNGTMGCVELARRCGAHLHFVSSGAVYGTRRKSDGPSREDQIGRFAPDPADPAQAYGNAKRMAEAILACAIDDYSISRPFAFLGPLLPLDKHFAAGNFLRDAAAGRPILVQGDGSPLRSYLHPADLAVWLLALLARKPRRQVVNVGSDDAISIAELAQRVSDRAGTPPPTVAAADSAPANPSAYWPDISAARAMGLRALLSIDRAIDDGLAWARQIGSRASR